MSEVQRYTLREPYVYGVFIGDSLEPHREGDWVAYEDHAAALAAKDALLREMAGLVRDAHAEGWFARWEDIDDDADDAWMASEALAKLREMGVAE